MLVLGNRKAASPKKIHPTTTFKPIFFWIFFFISSTRFAEWQSKMYSFFWEKPQALPYGKDILYSYHKNHFFLFIFGTFSEKRSQTCDGLTFFIDIHFFYFISMFVFSLHIKCVSSIWASLKCLKSRFPGLNR